MGVEEQMGIMKLLNKDAISINLEATDKEGVIKELIGLLKKIGAVRDEGKMFDIIMEREALGSTGIGQGVAIPHGKSASVKNIVAALGISKKGVDFDSLDGESAYIFFLLVAPTKSPGPHLKGLARISRLLKDKFFRDTLRDARDKEELIKIIKQEDERKY